MRAASKREQFRKYEKMQMKKNEKNENERFVWNESQSFVKSFKLKKKFFKQKQN